MDLWCGRNFRGHPCGQSRDRTWLTIFKCQPDLAGAHRYRHNHADARDAGTAKALTLEARRIASNIAKLPTLLGKG